MGPDGGVLVDEERSITCMAMGKIPHDRLHVLSVDGAQEEVQRARTLCDRSGATFSTGEIEAEDLLSAFDTITGALGAFEEEAGREGDLEVAVQVNAGRHANRLSAAGLLACLHAGVPAHFVHEEGHDELSVLARAPLSPLLSSREEDALGAFPEEGIPLVEVGEHDTGALNGLKAQGLVEPSEGRLSLTSEGRALKAHVSRG